MKSFLKWFNLWRIKRQLKKPGLFWINARLTADGYTLCEDSTPRRITWSNGETRIDCE